MKKIISIIIIVAVFLGLFSMSINASEKEKQVSVVINCDTKVDFSKIELKISSITRYLETEHLERIETNDSFTIMVGKTGKTSFEKPSEDYSIEINLESLPSGYGVKQSIIYRNNADSNEVILFLYKIEKVEPFFIYNDINYRFLNKEGDCLHVNYSTSQTTVELYDKSMVEDNSQSVDVIFSGKININGEEKEYSISKNYNVETDLEKVNLLYYFDAISFEEYISEYCDIIDKGPKTKYNNHDTIDNLYSLLEKTRIHGEEYSRIEKTINSLMRTNEEYDSVVSINYSCNNSTHCSENGSHLISVFYDSSAFTSNTAQAVAYEVENVLSFLGEGCGFNCPESLPSPLSCITANFSPCICVFLTEQISEPGKAGAYVNSTYGWIDINGSTLYDSNFKTVVAHELFHLIQLSYRLTKSSDRWIKESTANMAAILYADYLGELSSHLNEWKAGVEHYLQSAEFSITKEAVTGANTYSLRKYSSLFPLMLHQTIGGESAIASIFSAINSTRSQTVPDYYSNQDILNAINTVGLLYSNPYSLRDILEEFGYNNYLGYNSYNFLSGASWGNNAKVNLIPLTMNSSSACSIDELGYGYFKISSSPQTVPLRIISASNDVTATTIYIIESTSNIVYASTKYTMAGSTLNLNYSFSTSATDLVIIVECTSTVYGAYSIIYAN